MTYHKVSCCHTCFVLTTFALRAFVYSHFTASVSHLVVSAITDYIIRSVSCRLSCALAMRHSFAIFTTLFVGITSFTNVLAVPHGHRHSHHHNRDTFNLANDTYFDVANVELHRRQDGDKPLLRVSKLNTWIHAMHFSGRYSSYFRGYLGWANYIQGRLLTLLVFQCLSAPPSPREVSTFGLQPALGT